MSLALMLAWLLRVDGGTPPTPKLSDEDAELIKNLELLEDLDSAQDFDVVQELTVER